MKLGALKSAIRKMKGSPKVGGIHRTDVGPVELTDLEVSKQSMLAALDRAFPDGTKGTETGLYVKANGHIGVVGKEDDTRGESSQEPVEGLDWNQEPVEGLDWNQEPATDAAHEEYLCGGPDEPVADDDLADVLG